ncbi:MAG: DnaD domain protein [Chloroflexi bacterium]|nr:DnaD domain protein [Chloroflexota bacterium]MCL5110323.1 DnaD domain protein [Chloroflexota bacterium]
MTLPTPHFDGFPAHGLAFTPVPDLFFSRLLPQIDNLAELKVTLHLLWLVYHQKGSARLVHERELLADRTLLGGLGATPAETLAVALERAVARGTILHLAVDTPGGVENVYLPNTGEGRRAVEQIKAGEVRLPSRPRQPAVVVTSPSPLVTVFERRVGLLSPIVLAELAQAEHDFGAAAVEAAIAEAVKREKPSWAYIKRVLEGRQRKAGGAVSNGQAS